jgi:hypothetical protein
MMMMSRHRAREAVMIRAKCHTADNERLVEFDATPWFEVADERTIALLAEHDWQGTWVADALERAPGYEALHELMAYARDQLEKESREDPSWLTFQCRIDAAAALAWLGENRPRLAARLSERG